MIKNYFIIAWRNIKRHRFFSFINIFSLGLSMSVSLLIILMLADQKKYDHFHQKKDRIHRIISKSTYGFSEYATSPLPVLEELNLYMGIENSVQLINSIGGDAIYNGKATEMAGFYTDPSFFEIFSFDLSQGNIKTALKDPYSLVITQEAAHKLFGTEDPMGKVILFQERGIKVIRMGNGSKESIPLGAFTITGILKQPPYKSHIKFDVLASSATIKSLENKNIRSFSIDDWQKYTGGYSYILLKEEQNPDHIIPLLNKIAKEKYASVDPGLKLSFSLQPFTKITPGKYLEHPITLRMPLVIYYVFLGFAFTIILFSCFNYTNLSVARAMTRAREVGIRKATGATRKQLLTQFLGESVLVALLSLLFAIGLLFLIKPAFINLWVNQYLNFDLNENVFIYIVFLAFAVLIGILAGLFPGFYLSKFKPSAVLSNFVKIKPTHIPIIKKVSLYKLLVIFQFSISLLFIITTLLIVKQANHYMSMDYGFNSQGIVNVDLQGHSFEKVKQQFSAITGIKNVAASDNILTTPSSDIIYVKPPEADEEQQFNFVLYHVNREFFETHDIDLIAGTIFPEAELSNQEMVIINEQGLSRLGLTNPYEAIDLNLFIDESNQPIKVIGVVKDFVHSFVFAAIDNVMLRYDPEKFQFANVEIAGADMSQVIAEMSSAWKEMDPVHPLKYDFFDDQVKNSYLFLGDITKIIGFIAFLAIMISCFGLLGITTFITETRIKEVGVRKVMGAGVWQLNWLLAQNFIVLLAISVIFAAPAAYYFNNFWLLNLANRINFSLGIVLSGVLIMIFLGVGTVIIQTTRIARLNPVDSLRTE